MQDRSMHDHDAAPHDDDAALWRTLQPLRSTARYLMTGAHPDDEWSGFLAWLAYGRGVRTVYACATRGEGGQSALGPERGRALGALRSREMEEAARAIGLALRWVGAGPTHGADDPIVDFGFSKSAEDTLARWGEVRLVARLVGLIRAERPDAVSPTFLDVPGQHGHHRAITRATLRAVALAADPDYADVAGRPAWTVAKVYLPAFSGAGGSYDDELPPPPATVSVDLGQACDALALSWAQLGEASRRWHASQGMGRDLTPGPRPFALHLASGVPDAALPMDGLVRDMGDLAETLAGGREAGVRAAARAAAEAVAAFPRRRDVARALHGALAALARVEARADDDDAEARLNLKRRQLGRAAAAAAGLRPALRLSPATPRAGLPARLAVSGHGHATVQVRVPAGWTATPRPDGAFDLAIPADAAARDTQRDDWEPLGGNDLFAARLAWTDRGIEVVCEADPPSPLAVAPAVAVTVAPARVVRAGTDTAPVRLVLTGALPPATWPVRRAGEGGQLDIDLPPGRLDLPDAGTSLSVASAPHVGIFAVVEPARASLLRLDVAIDADARVGVVAGEVDVTLGWLRQLGLRAAAVDDATLEGGDLGHFTTLLVGIFGFGQRPALGRARARILAWVEAGGSLVTLYHRPSDNWDPVATPPRRLVIGRPSLRWRVTDPAAPVHVLAPDHPLLRRPNVITPADWSGWTRERGLYFASDWDPAYTPLLALSDPGETPLRGGLLAAPIGRGRHVHVALALHHQFAALVPGAFRLLSNFVAHG